jgi:predicted MFS family arabinose efflux permease
MLMLAYACNFMDRTIIGTLAQAIKVDLKITDGQLGLLQGFAFVVLYSVMGLPIARLTERHDRVTIISVCLAAWSAMTMLCGMAGNFVQLLLFRIGVGVGEAGCNAPSHSMIADAFDPQRRSRAISLYNIGATIGTMIGAMSGGVIAQHLGWRAAFLIVGAPGLLLAVAMRLFVREPARKAPSASAPVEPSIGIRRLAASLVRSPALRHLILGFTLASFGVSGLGAFTQPYFIRAFGLTYTEIGLIFGLCGGLASVASLLISGRLADAGAARDARWHGWVPAIGVTCSIPFAVSAFLVGHWPVALACVFLNTLMVSWFIAPTLGAIHKLLGARQVAMGMALILMFQNFVGLGGGPFFTGVLIDGLGQHFFGALGDFAAMCPGGAAPAGAPEALATACHTSLTQATRFGIIATVAAQPWAALHFLLAARHLRKALAEADAHAM